ncbi:MULTISPECIES: type II toxin-antitoxin system HicB family antitoxin [unclassified Duganella]|uniref:type II toxin-antitoxin system HicB family antitoxin n=1 Tax=unclassified Duganella TaxID=2636909 RepID=UPI001314A272|nr:MULTISPECIES: type II toxin-antitoxin system HicB family antitoxin [unclassified Duganella]
MDISDEEIRAILARPYVRCLLPDPDGGYTVTVHEFSGCVAEGDSAEEALRNFDAAAASWIAAAVESGYPIAEPIEASMQSGRIALRIPGGLHQDIAYLAQLDECSINQLLSVAIAEYVGRRHGTPVNPLPKKKASIARSSAEVDVATK